MTRQVIERHDDWLERLEQFAASVYRTAFDPGTHDCALFAASGVMVQSKHGLDFAAEFRGRYSTLEDGLKLIQAAGHADHVELAASHLFECAPAEARIGDIAAVDFGDYGLSLMIVGGPHLVGPMPIGRGSLNRLRAYRAFAVGWQP